MKTAAAAAAAATIPAAGQMGRGTGDEWQWSRVILSPTLGAAKSVNYLLPFAGCLYQARLHGVVTSWAVVSSTLCSNPSFAIYYPVRLQAES